MGSRRHVGVGAPQPECRRALSEKQTADGYGSIVPFAAARLAQMPTPKPRC
jgi:hypothetical protein